MKSPTSMSKEERQVEASKRTSVVVPAGRPSPAQAAPLQAVGSPAPRPARGAATANVAAPAAPAATAAPGPAPTLPPMQLKAAARDSLSSSTISTLLFGDVDDDYQSSADDVETLESPAPFQPLASLPTSGDEGGALSSQSACEVRARPASLGMRQPSLSIIDTDEDTAEMSMEFPASAPPPPPARAGSERLFNATPPPRDASAPSPPLRRSGVESEASRTAPLPSQQTRPVVAAGGGSPRPAATGGTPSTSPRPAAAVGTPNSSPRPVVAAGGGSPRSVGTAPSRPDAASGAGSAPARSASPPPLSAAAVAASPTVARRPLTRSSQVVVDGGPLTRKSGDSTIDATAHGDAVQAPPRKALPALQRQSGNLGTSVGSTSEGAASPEPSLRDGRLSRHSLQLSRGSTSSPPSPALRRNATDNAAVEEEKRQAVAREEARVLGEKRIAAELQVAAHVATWTAAEEAKLKADMDELRGALEAQARADLVTRRAAAERQLELELAVQQESEEAALVADLAQAREKRVAKMQHLLQKRRAAYESEMVALHEAEMQALTAWKVEEERRVRDDVAQKRALFQKDLTLLGASLAAAASGPVSSNECSLAPVPVAALSPRGAPAAGPGSAISMSARDIRTIQSGRVKAFVMEDDTSPLFSDDE